MKRKLKFRLWAIREIGENDKPIFKMIRPEDIEISKYPLFPHQLEDEENYKVMQFTGLIDAKGKEIFEGDVVKKTTYPQQTFIVEFEKGKYNICGYSQLSLRVIGNIYENPELIAEAGKI